MHRRCRSVDFQQYLLIRLDLRCTQEYFLNVILSREDYANMVGTATESAIRILSQFKNEGLISTSGKQIKIKDIEGGSPNIPMNFGGPTAQA